MSTIEAPATSGESFTPPSNQGPAANGSDQTDLLAKATAMLAGSRQDAGNIPAPQPEENRPGEESKAIPKDKQSELYAQLARRDRILAQKDREIKEREKQLQEQIQGIEGKYSKFKDIEEIKDPVKVMQQLGFTPDQILERLMNDDYESDSEPAKSQTEDKKYQELLAKIEAQNELVNSLKAEREKEQQETAAKQERSEINALIEATPDEYPWLKAMGPEVVERIRRMRVDYQNTHNVSISIKATADWLEDYFENEGDKFRSIPKRDKYRKQAPDGSQEEGRRQDPYERKESMTLNNSLTSPSGASGYEPMTEEERLKRAASLIKFTP